MQHASDAFPSHWVVLLDVGLSVLALVAAAAAPRWLAAPDRRFWPALRRWARHPATAFGLVFALGVLGNGMIFLLQGPPVPWVTDEHAYLLAADTFAHGRLANPSSPFWRHFDVPSHILHWPVYAAKYPPAQGLFLALGQVLAGSPAFALCLGAGLLPALAWWALRGWLPPSWALYGGLTVLLRLGAGSYWNQSYWGGTVAAMGGALVYGALPRLLRRPALASGLLFALGLAVLANSRPYEGLLASLPALAAVGWAARRSADGRALRRVLAAPAVFLGLVALGMGYYNQRLTGDPLCLPHRAYSVAYNTPPEFVFLDDRGTPFGHQLRPPTCDAPRLLADPASWFRRSIAAAGDRAARGLFFFLGTGLTLALFTLAGRGGRRPGGAGRSRHGAGALGWTLVAACALVAAGESVTRVWFAHYPSPVVVPLLALALLGGRRLRAWRWRGRPAGRSLPLLILSIQLLLFVFQLPAHRPDDGHWSVQRASFQAFLEARGGKHLVIVRPGGDWIANRADLDRAAVVWARDLGEERNRELLRHFADREVWWLDLRRAVR
ncbi:MAG: hypothetical protein D6696_06945 [Acidobacteria bacterium]|nr:MAG: hypothetical protein D6696_06945 [Acidobacteriota bacterium]